MEDNDDEADGMIRASPSKKTKTNGVVKTERREEEDDDEGELL